MQKYLTTFLIIISPIIYSKDNEKGVPFKPYMVNHLNEGCPIGSECTKKYGQKEAAIKCL